MIKKKILITGSTGLLGEHLIHSAPTNTTLIGTFHTTEPRIHSKNVRYTMLDLHNIDSIERLVKSTRPNVVIHCASLGNVDYCQTHKEEATRINTHATNAIFTACTSINAKFVFLSTNAIYNGKKPPYNELSTPDPIDHYGVTKFLAEQNLPHNSNNVLIVRLMTMYGWNNPKERNNPVTWLINEFKKKSDLHIVDDVYNNHLYADDAARAIWKLIDLNKFGVYNIAGPEVMSRYQLARLVASMFNFKGKIISVSSSYFPSLAPTPSNTSFSIAKIKKDILFRPKSIAAGLKHMKKLAKKENA